MARKRKRQRRWTLLFRREEDGQAVYLYEPLKKGELRSRLRNGWTQIQ